MGHEDAGALEALKSMLEHRTIDFLQNVQPDIDSHGEGQADRGVRHDEHRPRRLVETRHDPVQVDERRLATHGGTETDVVAVIRVRAAVAIAQASLSEAVVVGAVTSLDGRSSRNGQRYVGKDRGLEYAFRPYEGHPCAREVETSGQERAGKGRITEASPQIAE